MTATTDPNMSLTNLIYHFKSSIACFGNNKTYKASANRAT